MPETPSQGGGKSPESTGAADANENEEQGWFKEWMPWAAVAVIIILGLGGWILWGMSTTVAVPDVVGMTTEDAESAIVDAGFVVGSVEGSGTADTEPGVVLEQDPEAETGAEPEAKINLIVSVELLVEVPDVTGMTEEDALAALEAEGFVAEAASYYTDAEAGTVAAQLPEAGSEVAAGSEVGVLVSMGPSPEKIDVIAVPDVIGQAEADAVTAMTEVGLTVRVYYAPSDDVDAGTVMDQEPAAGTKVAISTTVVILVSTGGESEPPEPGTILVPDVKDMTEADAEAALGSVGLVAQSAPIYSSDVASGTVAVQWPAAETEVLAGSAVAIAISQGPESEDAVEVPDVIGSGSSEAVDAMEGLGLTAVAFESATPEGLPADEIFAQLPAGGSTVPPGSVVLLLAANGKTGDVDPIPMSLDRIPE